MSESDWWHYENLPSRHPYDWSPAHRGDRPWDQLDFHLDLGCGRVPKGRLGIDLRPSPGATDLAIDLNTLLPAQARFDHDCARAAIVERTNDHYRWWRRVDCAGRPYPGLPFPNDSIKSICTHHALEHIGDGFERLMEECYRVLEPGGVMRVIVPCFPSHAAVADYDHKRYFMPGTFIGFTGVPDGTLWSDGFSESYNTARFRVVDEDWSPMNPPEVRWTQADMREMRVTLYKWMGDPADPNPEDYAPAGSLNARAGVGT